jgi:hypothetical protein
MQHLRGLSHALADSLALLQPKGGRKSSGDVEGCVDDRTKGAVLKDGDGDASVAELKWSDVTPWKLIVADSFATIVEKSLLFPIDTLRTRMQVTIRFSRTPPFCEPSVCETTLAISQSRRQCHVSWAQDDGCTHVDSWSADACAIAGG